MTELEAQLRAAIDRPLTEDLQLPPPADALARRIWGLKPQSFAWHRVNLVAVPGPGPIERLLNAVWLNNPLSRFNRQARNREVMAWWKTVWR